MARPRKSPHLKNQPITISLPPKMIAEIDEMLSYQANRSKWFQDAADSKIKTDEHISINTKMTDLISEIDSIETAIHAYRINPKVLAQLHQSLSSLYYTMNPQEGA